MNSLDRSWVMRRALDSPPPIAENIRMFYDLAKRVDTDYCLILPEDILCNEKWGTQTNTVWTVSHMSRIHEAKFWHGPIAVYSSAGRQEAFSVEEILHAEEYTLWPHYGHVPIGWSIIYSFPEHDNAHCGVIWGVTKSSMYEVDPCYVFTDKEAAEKADKLLNS